METNPKEIYVCPAVDVVELDLESFIMAGSKPDYMPEEW